jgi:large subunit ribosomal protein L17
MRHRIRTAKLGRTGEHRNAMLANMVCSLIEKTRITTTLAKAKAARVVAEKMVTLGKKGTLHHRRLAAARLRAPQRKFFHGTNTTPGKGSGANAVKGKDLREAWRKEHDVVRILFDEIAPKFQDRMGGYTRIVKIAGARKGDAAQMAILMWVGESLEEKAKAKPSTAAKPKPAQDKAEDSPETPEASATEEASGDTLAEASAEESAEAPAEESAEAPAEESAEAPAEESAEAPAEESAEAPAEESADTGESKEEK